MNKTFIPSKQNNVKQWYLIDAKNATLGRLASEVAKILRGKNKSIYTPFMDTGDFVIIINAQHVAVTGNKENQKTYFRHSGKPGGATIETFKQVQNRLPNRIVEKAIKGMLPKGPLGRKLFKNVKVYANESHIHQAQMPKLIQL
uniref:Large ribosomal subunit protein uL13c n=1 Tax=Bulboplastis apyrenoidosa TaxID=1070855 RepID=A0A1Y9TM56_9RHOD|nr:50S ribosomal protein L13 [Bulboplastis apyrenoidosa]ARO90720.1 50S ribosomal protein L13 [Bulboplastis apyrenoidosa]